MLHNRFQNPVYAIYGFVRLADEIVDTFHNCDKRTLLDNFKSETYKALAAGISTNPVLQSFQLTVQQYRIERNLIDAFFYSMELDLNNTIYDDGLYSKYIFGSAEVVGLMCLRVFSEGNDELYNSLSLPARHLGAAFQKVNFLRDIRKDYQEQGRVYFPGVDFSKFDNQTKKEIEQDIEKDFRAAYPGIIQLPKDVRPGVYTAFIYYRELLKKIQKVPASRVMEARVRIPDRKKIILLLRTYTKFGFTIF
jgi:phytoene/squalene synthetase